MASTSSVKKSSTQEARLQGDKIEQLEAALKASHEKFQRAQDEHEKTLQAAQEQIVQLKAEEAEGQEEVVVPDELEVFLWSMDTPVIFHPRLRNKAIDARCAIDDNLKEGQLETVYLVATDAQWDSFYGWGKGEAPSWESMTPFELTDDEDEDEDEDKDDEE